MSGDPLNLIWIVQEMTGLDTSRDYIIEIATVVTDSALIVLAEGPVIALHQSDSVLNAMDKWNQDQHGKSGLTERVRTSKYREAEAERLTIDFLSRYAPPRCVSTASARTVAFSRAACRSSNAISTTATSTLAR